MDKRAQDWLLQLQNRKEARQPHLNRWKQITEYLVPNRSVLMDGLDDKGRLTHSNVFDGSPIHALQLLVNGYMGNMVNASYLFYKFRMRDYRLNEIDEVKEYLQESASVLYGELQQSNFYAAVAQYIMDAASVGTATINVGEDLKKGELQYLVRHPVEIFIATDIAGNVDTVFREYKMSARNAIGFFHKKVSLTIQQAAEHTPFEEFEFLHVVSPRDKRNPNLLSAQHKPIASEFIEINKGETVKTGGYDSMPLIVWRWDIASGEDYGRSPGSNAIKDVIMLNQVGRSNLITAQKIGDPPLNIPLEQRGLVNLGAGGRNYYEEDKRIITPAIGNPSLSSAVDREARLENIIRKHFFTDFFLMLQQAERTKTAREVNELAGEKAIMLASITGRFGKRLDEILSRSFALAYAAGRMPPAPDILRRYAEETGKNPAYDIEYLGPLAQAQRRLFKSEGILQGLDALLPVFQLDPKSLDVFDWDKMARELAESQGMPESVIRDPRVVQKIRAVKQKIMEQQMQQQQGIQAAEVIPKLSRAPEPGSPLEKMAEAEA